MGKTQANISALFFYYLQTMFWEKKASFGVRITLAGYWCTCVTGLPCLASRSQPTSPVALSDCFTLNR